MLIRMQLIGNGTESNPYRVSFPTYNMIDCDYKNKVAVIEIRDDDVPSDILESTALFFTSHNRKESDNPDTVDNVVISIPSNLMLRLNQYLDERYQEHKGKFRPVVQ